MYHIKIGLFGVEDQIQIIKGRNKHVLVSLQTSTLVRMKLLAHFME